MSLPRIPTLVAVLAILTITGCGRKPVVQRLPGGLTAERALASVNVRASRIHDLSATAAVIARTPEGAEHRARVSIRYRRPARFRIKVSGFAGITVALVATTPDSVYAYDPSGNTYLCAARSDDMLRRMIPELRFDLERLTGIFSGTPPPETDRDDPELSLVRTGGQAVLTVDAGDTIARYTLAGPDLLVVAEEISVAGETVWRVESEDFETVDGVPVATRIKAWGARGTVEMDLSRITVNEGISDAELTLSVPSSAERIVY